MKIGIFGGTFNPIHIGHAIIANFIAQNSCLDAIWFMVAPQNPLKTEACGASDLDRIKMVEMVAHKIDKVTTSAFESQVKLALRGENVMIESGGITWLYNYEFYPFPSAVRSIKQAADWVGIDRLMWGSDYPRTITAITYRMSYDFISKSRELSDADKAAFLGGNAKRFYSFDKLVELPYIKNMSE